MLERITETPTVNYASLKTLISSFPHNTLALLCMNILFQSTGEIALLLVAEDKTDISEEWISTCFQQTKASTLFSGTPLYVLNSV